MVGYVISTRGPGTEDLMPLPLLHIDAFTDRPFAGNPAAVCLLRKAAPDSWMQALAAEMNLSETAFPLPEGDGYRLRWFTPTVEVDLCGHATIATSHALWETTSSPPPRAATFSRCSRGSAWMICRFT